MEKELRCPLRGLVAWNYTGPVTASRSARRFLRMPVWLTA